MKEKCYSHPEKKTLTFCHSCGHYFCADCLTEGVEYFTAKMKIAKKHVK